MSKAASTMVFVAGATGAVGKVPPALVVAKRCKDVRTTRSPDKAQVLRVAETELVVADALDRTSVIENVDRASDAQAVIVSHCMRVPEVTGVHSGR